MAGAAFSGDGTGTAFSGDGTGTGTGTALSGNLARAAGAAGTV